MIFFDIDGTLLDDERAMMRGLDSLHANYGSTIGLAREDLSLVWLQLLDQHFHRFLAGEISMDEQRRARMRALLGNGLGTVDDERCDAAFAVYLDAYERGWAPYADVGDALARLKDRPLGVITNGDHAQQLTKLERTHLASLFSVVITSGGFGAAKPDRRIFEEACRRADVHTTAAIYIGDDWAKDIAGSRAAGLQPIWVRRGRRTPAVASADIPVIDTFAELPAALADLGASDL